MHPFGQYFRQGLRVTLNTDNRLMSATTVTEEIALAAKAFRLSPYEIKRIILNGFKSAFMPYPQKARMLREVNLEIDRRVHGRVPAGVRPARQLLTARDPGAPLRRRRSGVAPRGSHR